MAAPAYFGSASTPADNGSNSTDPVSVTPPASMLAGDLVVVEVTEDTGGQTITVSNAGGQSWTAEAAMNGNLSSRVLWCTFNGTWAANPSFDVSGTVTCESLVMHVFRGNGAGYAWEQDVAFASTILDVASGAITRAGLTTVGPNSLVVAGWTQVNVRTMSSLSGSGWAVAGSAQYRNLAGGDQVLAHAYYSAPTPATIVPNVSYTSSSSFDGFTWIMAWREVVGPTVLVPALYTRTKTMHPPTLVQDAVAAPPLLEQIKTLYEPTILPTNDMAAPLLTQTKTLHAPAVLLGDEQLLRPPLLEQIKTLFSPTIPDPTPPQDVIAPLLTQDKVLFAPAVANTQILVVPLIADHKELFAPRFPVEGGASGGRRTEPKKRVKFFDREKADAEIAAQQEAERAQARAILEGIAQQFATQQKARMDADDEESMAIIMGGLI